jgi:hypothetical protein
MRKVILTVLVMTGIVSATKAQSIHFGLKAGLNVATLSDVDGSSRASFHGGGFVNFRFRQFAIQPELLYSGQGEKYSVPIAGDRTWRLGYINVPVMFQYYPVRPFYIEAGPQLGFMVSAKDHGGNVTADVKDAFNTADFGLGLGLGYKFPVGIGVYGRYVFGLSDISDSDRTSVKNSVGQLGVSYTFK